MSLPRDYTTRIYAGILGKLIGVYLGRPFEGWTFERIVEDLGEIDDYVHDRFGDPLVVTDDDIAGTFTFVWVLEDCSHPDLLTSEAVGKKLSELHRRETLHPVVGRKRHINRTRGKARRSGPGRNVEFEITESMPPVISGILSCMQATSSNGHTARQVVFGRAHR